MAPAPDSVLCTLWVVALQTEFDLYSAHFGPWLLNQGSVLYTLWVVARDPELDLYYAHCGSWLVTHSLVYTVHTVGRGS